MSIKALFGGAAAALVAATLVASPGVASAATYVTQLDWTDDGGHVASKGTVTLAEQADGKTVRVTVDLNDDLDRIIDTGSHWAFTWNLTDVNSVVTLISTGGTNPFVYQDPASGPFTQTGAFGSFTNAFACCGPGRNNGKTSLVFDVFNAGGLTFAGTGPDLDAGGKLVGLGDGNRFKSNTTGTEGGFEGGWWFAADIYDAPGGTGPGGTYVVAGRDAFCVDGCSTGVVPEPGTWALMILGFGGAGAMLRRRRHALA